MSSLDRLCVDDGQTHALVQKGVAFEVEDAERTCAFHRRRNRFTKQITRRYASLKDDPISMTCNLVFVRLAVMYANC